MEYVVFFAIVIAFLVIVSILGMLNEKRSLQNFRDKLHRTYGGLPEGMDNDSKFLYVSKYFEKHRAETAIDDITWNDLSMDQVFRRMNYCYSGAGEEYLYYMLRTPQQSDDFELQEQHVRYFMEHEALRNDCQVIFAGMANRNRYSIYDYLDYLDHLGKRSNLMNLTADFLLVVSIIGCFFSFSTFFIMLIVVLIFNIVTYFRDKAEIDPYLSSFSYVMRLLKGVERFRKIKDHELGQELAELGDDEQKMAAFKAGSGILMSPTRMNASGNPLDILADYLRIVTHIDLIKFNHMLSEIRKHTDTVDHMITVLGKIDAEIAIGCFRASLADSYCIPQFQTSSDELVIRGLYHPGMEHPVPNSISCHRGVLITGSNASGKSTFLKTVAISAILAQSVHTVMAEQYTAPLYRIYTSMALRDDLVGGDSYYIVEIKSLKRILDAAEKSGCRILCMIDEVLRGTNTIERIAASSRILTGFTHRNIQCFAATHDIELTELLKEQYDNYHFEGIVTDNDVHFNYQIQEGPAKNRNAIKLLGILGYDPRLVKSAQQMADEFTKSGIWTMPSGVSETE